MESSIASDYTKSFSGYNLIILHQLPSTTDNASRIIAAINKSNVPVIFILGAQTDFNTFNSLKAGISIVANTKTSMNEALPVINNDFPLFTVGDDIKHLSDDLPPLYSPYGTYKTANSATSYFIKRLVLLLQNSLSLFSISKTGRNHV